MKKQIYLAVRAFIAIFVMALTACAPSAGAPAGVGGAGKIQAAPVDFTGVIEAMDGNQWTVNGQVVIVDPSVVRDGPFAVGDTVKIEGQVGADGLLTATRVEQPSAAAASANENASNANDNANDASANSNDNADDSNANGNDNESGEDYKVTGVVEAINGDQITINGVTYTVAAGVDLSGISVGDTITIEVVINADGTQTVVGIDSAEDDNSNDDNSNDDNSNDNDSNDDNSNDDNSNDDDSNDNHKGGDDKGGDDDDKGDDD